MAKTAPRREERQGKKCEVTCVVCVRAAHTCGWVAMVGDHGMHRNTTLGWQQ